MDFQQLRQQRLAAETGTVRRSGSLRVALVYPSTYPIGMSSLGFQTMYRHFNQIPGVMAERAFLPDQDQSKGPLRTYESGQAVGDFDVVAFSVAYELELAGLFRCLTLAGIAPLRTDRSDRAPLVIAGGPLTFSNPAPLAPFVDAVIVGEAEDVLKEWAKGCMHLHRDEALKSWRDQEGMFIPKYHGAHVPPVAQCADESMPAYSAIVTPDAVLSNMFLLETARGCSRACHFCVMRRSTNGGMRTIPQEKILERIPDSAKRVGLVGAAVSDHPHIVAIVRSIVDGGMEIGLSSLRANRLTPEFVDLLKRGGYRTLTVASDGASENLRRILMKKIRAKHLLHTAQLARDAGMRHLKVYMMLGVPNETEADIDELIEFSREQAEVCGPHTRLSLGIATFVAKRHTPLDGAPFMGIAKVQQRIRRVRKALKRCVVVRPTSARWSWVEYQLAQGGPAQGLAAYDAWQQGGRFIDYRSAFKAANQKTSHGSKNEDQR